MSLSIGDSVLQPSTVVRNLGVYIDEHLSMEDNARHCAKTCFFLLRRIRQLRRYVDHDTLYTLIRALILSRLDYCKGLFACSSQPTGDAENARHEYSGKAKSIESRWL